MLRMERQLLCYRGWDVVRLESSDLRVDVVPGKGGDITSIRWRANDVELLWQSPWGLRQRGAAHVPGDSEATLMDAYPGGWQTVFPNAGDSVVEHGVQWGMHGEAWLAPYDWEPEGTSALTLRTRLVRSPFELFRRIRLDGHRLIVSETARNCGGVPVEAAWGHHVAFGAPFLGTSCRLDTDARTIAVDDERDTPAGDLEIGARGEWPYVAGRSGEPVDLREVPDPDRPTARLGYLMDFGEQAKVTLTNVRLGLSARLQWDANVMPYSWLWYEMHATPGFPWYKGVYVLGIEPHSSYPGQGLAAIRRKTGTQVEFQPGQSHTATTILEVVPYA